MLSKNDDLEENYRDMTKTDLKKGIIEKMSQNDISNTKNANVWYLTHHPVSHPHKPGKVRTVCNAGSKYPGGYLWILFNTWTRFVTEDFRNLVQFSGRSNCNHS